MKTSILRECARRAINKLPRHPQSTWKHFSFIISDGKILSCGVNRTGEPDPSYPEHCKIHAEVDAFRKARGILDSDFDVVNIRMNKNGHIRMSAPCPHCENFLRSVKCSSVFYSTNEGFEEFVL